MLRSTVIPALLAASVVYGATAVLCYLLHFAAHPLTLSESLPFVAAVVAPYFLLFIGYYFTSDRWSLRVMMAVVAASSLAAAVLYADSFRPRAVADMYVGIYVLLPLLQSVVALVALLTVLYRAKRYPLGADLTGVGADTRRSFGGVREHR